MWLGKKQKNQSHRAYTCLLLFFHEENYLASQFGKLFRYILQCRHSRLTYGAFCRTKLSFRHFVFETSPSSFFWAWTLKITVFSEEFDGIWKRLWQIINIVHKSEFLPWFCNYMSSPAIIFGDAKNNLNNGGVWVIKSKITLYIFIPISFLFNVA